MLFERILYFGADFRFHTGDVEVDAGRIAAVRPRGCTPRAMLLPGLVDIHLHGNSGADFSDGAEDGLLRMARFLAAHGTTSFSPASLTLPEERLKAAYRTAARLHAVRPEGAAALRGITMEGPFFSMGKRGAQNPEHLRLPDAALFARLQREAAGLIRIACIAPELPGALDCIRTVAAEGVKVSLAHTEADYDTASAAFDAGAAHVTHLFNAMPPLLHRAPGVIGAASERETVTAELIADGIHVHPSAVRAAFRLFPGRVCLVSDALSACGMPEGEYMLGGQAIRVSGPARHAFGWHACRVCGNAVRLHEERRALRRSRGGSGARGEPHARARDRCGWGNRRHPRRPCGRPASLRHGLGIAGGLYRRDVGYGLKMA